MWRSWNGRLYQAVDYTEVLYYNINIRRIFHIFVIIFCFMNDQQGFKRHNATALLASRLSGKISSAGFSISDDRSLGRGGFLMSKDFVDMASTVFSATNLNLQRACVLLHHVGLASIVCEECFLWFLWSTSSAGSRGGTGSISCHLSGALPRHGLMTSCWHFMILSVHTYVHTFFAAQQLPIAPPGSRLPPLLCYKHHCGRCLH